MPRKMTREEFIEKATLLHKGKFNYDDVVYVDRNTKVRIYCPKHGYFEQAPREHLMPNKEGCPKCSMDKSRARNLMTKEEFIKRARNVHGNKYDYSLVNYVNAKTKVIIVCPKHGSFEQIPYSHINRKHGCPHCKADVRRKSMGMNKKEFFDKVNELYKDTYDFSKSVYVDTKTPVDAYCSKHDKTFSVKPPLLLRGCACPDCGHERQGLVFKKNHDDFIEQANKKHNFKYDYSLTKYKHSKGKILIICHEKDEDGNEHGVFEQNASEHVNGAGCPKCSSTYKLTTETFIKKANSVHNYAFDYSKVNYVNSHSYVMITCTHCKETFQQLAYDHLNGRGCPICAQSNLEQLVFNKLRFENIKFEKEYTFTDLGPLRYDFFLPEFDVLIECQGAQHFNEEASFFNEGYDFSIRLEHDIKKFRYAKANGYKIYYFLCPEKVDYTKPIFQGIYSEDIVFKDHNKLTKDILKIKKKIIKIF